MTNSGAVMVDDDDARGAIPPTGDRRHTQSHGLDGVAIRDADLEPKRGIRYVAWLFKSIAVLLVVVMLAEVTFALTDPGFGGVATLLGEAVRMLAFAGLLWGAADLALMLIQSHYDLRATRILITRQNALLARLAPPETTLSEALQEADRQQRVQLHREAQ